MVLTLDQPQFKYLKIPKYITGMSWLNVTLDNIAYRQRFGHMSARCAQLLHKAVDMSSDGTSLGEWDSFDDLKVQWRSGKDVQQNRKGSLTQRNAYSAVIHTVQEIIGTLLPARENRPGGRMTEFSWERCSGQRSRMVIVMSIWLPLGIELDRDSSMQTGEPVTLQVVVNGRFERVSNDPARLMLDSPAGSGDDTRWAVSSLPPSRTDTTLDFGEALASDILTVMSNSDISDRHQPAFSKSTALASLRSKVLKPFLSRSRG